ncbi:MAG: hypothetical protein U0670_05395 [Anaerolineae bacterium]
MNTLLSNRVSPKSLLSIGFTVLVLLIGIGIFLSAGESISGEGQVARTWLDALCSGDMDTLYATSLTLTSSTEGLNQEAFTERVRSYFESEHLELPCVGVLDLNQVRSIPVPLDLNREINDIRIFPEASLTLPNGDSHPIALWAYQLASGDWRIVPEFIAPTLESPAAMGTAQVINDSAGLLIGYLTVTGEASVYTDGGDLLIGVPLRMQTLSRQWEWIQSSLLMGSTFGGVIEHADQLPQALRSDFLNGNGVNFGQNLQVEGRLWFRFEARTTITGDLTLTLLVKAARSGVSLNTYMEVIPAAAEPIIWFPNPVRSVTLIGRIGSDLIFEAALANDTDRTLLINCNAFVAVLNSDEWIVPNYCAFAPDTFRLTLAPGESMRAQIKYNGLEEGQITRLVYRVSDGERLSNYPIWPQP